MFKGVNYRLDLEIQRIQENLGLDERLTVPWVAFHIQMHELVILLCGYDNSN